MSGAFYPNDRVTYHPSTGPSSAGAQGTVLRPWGNRYALVDFDGQRVLCAVADLQRASVEKASC